MTAELVLLLTAVVLVIGAILTNATATFRDASPALGARVEFQLSTGKGFEDVWEAN